MPGLGVLGTGAAVSVVFAVVRTGGAGKASVGAPVVAEQAVGLVKTASSQRLRRSRRGCMRAAAVVALAARSSCSRYSRRRIRQTVFAAVERSP